MRDNEKVTRFQALVVLFLAAVLEAGGDALIRAALRAPSAGYRAFLFVMGAGALFAYGCTVNAPPWDFGRLLGLYVVFFFVIAQVVSWAAFRQPPSLAVLAGGSLIVAGGLIIALATP